MINQDTNTLIVNGDTIVLDEGNYSVDDLQAIFSQTLSMYNITVSYSYVRNKFTFSCSTEFTISGESSILDRIGFISEDHTGTILTSDYAVDLSGTKFIYIYTNLQTKNFVNGVRNGCLVKISAVADMNSMILYSDSNAMPNYVDDIAISQLYFKLVDDDDNQIDLEGRKWSITLQVEYTPIPRAVHGNRRRNFLTPVKETNKPDHGVNRQKAQELREEAREET